MQAAVRRSYCEPEEIKIEQVEKPINNAKQVLIKVFATTVNRTDCANLTGRPFIMHFVLGLFKPRKIILGTDFAGQIVAVGKDVKSFKVNDRVFGFTDTGVESQAEYIKIDSAGNLLIIPDQIDYKPAVASLEGAHYAYSFIHKVKLQAGQKVLINGATGAIGSALLQFVNQFDVHISATCNSKNSDLIKSLGADKVFDYEVEDFTSNREEYDFIFDAVGKSTFGKCKASLTKHGIYISSELGPYAQNVFLAAFTPPWRKKKVIFPIPFNTKITLPYIKKLIEQVIFKPVIDREYALDDISQAYKYVAAGEKTGNVVVNISKT